MVEIITGVCCRPDFTQTFLKQALQRDSSPQGCLPRQGDPVPRLRRSLRQDGPQPVIEVWWTPSIRFSRRSRTEREDMRAAYTAATKKQWNANRFGFRARAFFRSRGRTCSSAAGSRRQAIATAIAANQSSIRRSGRVQWGDRNLAAFFLPPRTSPRRRPWSRGASGFTRTAKARIVITANRTGACRFPSAADGSEFRLIAGPLC